MKFGSSRLHHYCVVLLGAASVIFALCVGPGLQHSKIVFWNLSILTPDSTKTNWDLPFEMVASQTLTEAGCAVLSTNFPLRIGAPTFRGILRSFWRFTTGYRVKTFSSEKTIARCVPFTNRFRNFFRLRSRRAFILSFSMWIRCARYGYILIFFLNMFLALVAEMLSSSAIFRKERRGFRRICSRTFLLISGVTVFESLPLLSLFRQCLKLLESFYGVIHCLSRETLEIKPALRPERCNLMIAGRCGLVFAICAL